MALRSLDLLVEGALIVNPPNWNKILDFSCISFPFYSNCFFFIHGCSHRALHANDQVNPAKEDASREQQNPRILTKQEFYNNKIISTLKYQRINILK
jgi:hypothetical protein